MVFTKEYSLKHKFSNTMSNEGQGFLTKSLNDIYETKIEDIMVCIAHDNNTIPKGDWLVDSYMEKVDMKKYNEHVALLIKIFST
jgi:hypothetical protein